jgi:two-component system, NarL family, nitrate/nitrite response regulator NarL
MESPAIRLPPERTTESRTNLVVIVPNEVVRHGLEVILKSVACVATAHFCRDVWEAQHLVAVVAADMVLSYAGPGLSGEADEVFARMAAGGAKILSVLSWDAQERVEALTDLVADGYLLDSELTADSLNDAIGRLRSGEMLVSGTLMRQIVSRVRSRQHTSEMQPILTPREREVLSLLAQGLSNKQIARRLDISEHGAKRHVANVLAKLNCPNRTLAVAQALRAGYVSDACATDAGEAGFRSGERLVAGNDPRRRPPATSDWSTPAGS